METAEERKTTQPTFRASSDQIVIVEIGAVKDFDDVDC
jgi:hypothetical protein